jgi:hypothetical protein
VLRQDVLPIARGMSRSAGSRTLAMAAIAFLALATALALLASALNRGTSDPRSARRRRRTDRRRGNAHRQPWNL